MVTSNSSLEHDYVIVGGGSAGCVLAHRLTAERGIRVLLLEAGPDIEPFWVRTPAGVGNVFFDGRINWKFLTDPEPKLAGRSIYWPRGKIMGGSSAINGMAYVRGFPGDYDRWRDSGNPGWSWQDVVPYFQRAETSDSPETEGRGHDGPLRVSLPHEQHATTEAFVRACETIGIRRYADIVGATQAGVGYMQHTIADGLRSSVARAYLAPVRNRPNLDVLADAVAARLQVADGRVVGVEFIQGGTRHIARASKEVLVCAGVIGSPQLLMLSGIGESAQLQEHGLPVIRNLPGVGANLQDHLTINVGYEVRQGASMNASLSGWHKYLQGINYLLNKRGPLAVGTSHAVAFVCSDARVEVPDIELSFRSLSFAFDSKNHLRMHPFPGVQFAGAMLRPRSRGQLTLRSTDPNDPPRIHGGYLTDRDDERVMIATMRWIRRIAAASPLVDLMVREDLPGAQVESDDQVMEFVRHSSQSLYHPAGTCAMGTGPQAVVDARLRVHGVLGLRVVDASVMPTIVSGNINAPTIMIAEKAADMILDDARHPSPLIPSEVCNDVVHT